MNVALILAGGVGSRVGANRPKQFIEVCGKPIIAYTIEIYQQNPQIDAIEVVCHSQWQDYLYETIEKFQLTKVRWVAPGGETFQESVINGVNFLRDKIAPSDIVMIHYGAAPFTSQAIVNDALAVCQEHGMSASCTPCFQLMGTDDGATSNTWVDRDKFTQIACPQSFRYELLLDIYARAEEQGLLATIEPHTTSLMYALGMPIHKSYGDQTNIKITTKEDLELFECVAGRKKEEHSRLV